MFLMARFIGTLMHFIGKYLIPYAFMFVIEVTYINIFLCGRSYLLMEKMFKIYVYEEGDPPIFHYGLCKDIYSMEGLFLNFMGNDVLTYRTRDPDKAHVYFLPFSVVMILHHLLDPVVRDKAVLERVIVDYVQIISEKYPYWNSSDGFDHFMLSCHDWVSCSSVYLLVSG